MMISSWRVVAVLLASMSQIAVAESPAEVFERRLRPIFKSDQPSSCVQCHLAGVDLKDYIKPSSDATFWSLRDQELVDVKQPERSKILRLIKMTDRDNTGANLLHAKTRETELAAFTDWLTACCHDQKLRDAPKLKPSELAKPKHSDDVIRHARSDRLLDSFEQNIWGQRHRCMGCHVEGSEQNRKLVAKHGEQVAWMKKSSAETMTSLIRTKHLIDVENPEKSDLLLKPLGEIEHGGGKKFLKGDLGYKNFRTWLEDYAKIVRDEYVNAADLPKSDPQALRRFSSELWFKLTDPPAEWDQKLLQVTIYRWDERVKTFEESPIAISDRQASAKFKTWQHTLTLLAAPGSDRAAELRREPGRLPPGKYLVKVHVDRDGRLLDDWRAEMRETDYVGQADFQAQWRPDYGAMTVVEAVKLRLGAERSEAKGAGVFFRSASSPLTTNPDQTSNDLSSDLKKTPDPVALSSESAAALAALIATTANGGSSPKPIELGSRRELFLDRFLIDKLTNCRLELATPRDEGIAVKLDKPWEGPFGNYATVIKDDERTDGQRFLMYYRGISEVGRDGSNHERTCVAVSKDGLAWTKPELGLFAVPGSADKTNNVVMADQAPVSHNFSPVLDTRPGIPKAERFKALGGTSPKGLIAFASEDGFRWKRLRDEPVVSDKQAVNFKFQHMFDSQNLAFWSVSENCYVCYFRVWDGLRRIARTTSANFLDWSPAMIMQQVHDDGSGPQPAPPDHLYTNQTSPYFRAPHIATAIAARFFPGRTVLTDEQAKAIGVDPKYFGDTSDAVFLTTRGGHVYDRTFLEGFIRPGIGPQNWVSRTNYPALNIVQTGPAEMSLYVDQDYAQPTNHLRRYSLRLDGFASVRAGYLGGELLTKPFTFTGEKLFLNFATSAAGDLRIELQDAVTSQPIPGFTLADSQEMIGNEIERAVAWKSGDDVRQLAGKPIRLRIALKDADLFALRFGK